MLRCCGLIMQRAAYGCAEGVGQGMQPSALLRPEGMSVVSGAEMHGGIDVSMWLPTA